MNLGSVRRTLLRGRQTHNHQNSWCIFFVDFVSVIQHQSNTIPVCQRIAGEEQKAHNTITNTRRHTLSHTSLLCWHKKFVIPFDFPFLTAECDNGSDATQHLLNKICGHRICIYFLFGKSCLNLQQKQNRHIIQIEGY